MFSSYQSLIFTLPEIFFSLSSLFLLTVSLYLSKIQLIYIPSEKILRTNDSSIIRKTGIMGSFILLFYLILENENKEIFLLLKNRDLFLTYYNNLFKTNLFVFNVKLFIIIVSLIILFLIINNLKFEYIYSFEYVIIFLFSIFGMILMTNANDFIIFYLCLEYQSFALYILLSYKTFKKLSAEAGLKYFILGALASGIMLLGMSILYYSYGSLNFTELNILNESLTFLEFKKHVNTNFDLGLVITGIIFVFSGVLFKLAVAPFHFWVPDIYDGSTTITTLIIATLPKISVFISFLTFYFPFIFTFNISLLFKEKLMHFIMVCVLISIIIGAFGAISQKKIKRLLAYSAIANSAFIILCFAYPAPTMIFSCTFYLFYYVITLLGIFTILLSLRKKNNSFFEIIQINELSMILKNNFALSISFVILLFSLSGIPPLMGFYSKLYIFFGLIIQDNYKIATIIIFVSVLMAFYYLRMIRIILFNPVKHHVFLEPLSYSSSLIVSIIIHLNMLFFFAPNFFLNIIVESINSFSMIL